jgi:UDP-glucose 4-epimerase
MNLLITGIAGFIGSRIAEAALRKGHNVVGVDDLSQGYQTNVPEKIDFRQIDLTQPDCVNYLPQNIDAILHLAGQSSGEISFDNPIADLQKNAVSTLNLIKYGIEIKAKKIIYASSMSVYGTTVEAAIPETIECAPLSCYGTGKLAAEHYLEIYKSKLPYIAFRMFNVYGPGQDMSNLRQGMVSIYLAHILKNKHISVKGSLNRFRDFIYIDDVVNIWLQAIINDAANNHKFNLATGVQTTVLQLLEKIKEIIPGISWSETDNTPGDQFGIYADTTKLKEFFDISNFTSLDSGLERFIKWAKDCKNN